VLLTLDQRGTFSGTGEVPVTPKNSRPVTGVKQIERSGQQGHCPIRGGRITTNQIPDA